MHWFSIDYRKDEPHKKYLLNKGFWVYLPRLVLRCRLLGHKPVVDGTEGFQGQPGYRWVACNRCGLRPDPQGVVRPEVEVGTPYKAGFGVADANTVLQAPGYWPQHPEGTIGIQTTVWGYPGLGINFTVGSPGADHTLSGHLHLGRLFGLYWTLDRFGTWVQRRLVPTGYDSRVIALKLTDRYLHWELWAKENRWSHLDHRWMEGSINVSPLDRVLGPKRYTYTPVGDSEVVFVRWPDGKDYDLKVQLQRTTLGRQRGKKSLSWTAECSSPNGIPLGPGDWISRWSVPVSDFAATSGLWPEEAKARTVLRYLKELKQED